MMIMQQKCMHKDHQDEHASQLCCYWDCQEANRTMCFICRERSLQHQHDLIGDNHFQDLKDFRSYNQIRLKSLKETQNKFLSFINQRVKNLLINIQQIHDIINEKNNDFIKKFDDLDKKLQLQQINYGDCQKDMASFYQLSQNLFKEIHQNSQEFINNTQTQLDGLVRIMTQKQVNLQDQPEILDQGKDFLVKFSQISLDERYLVVCSYNQKQTTSHVIIKDLMLNYEIQKMQFKNALTSCDFYESSLYMSDNCGFIHILRFKQDSYYQYQKIKHDNEIVFLKVLDKTHLIITTKSKQLIIVNTRKQDKTVVSKDEDIIQDNIHDDLVQACDYSKQQSMIATCSHDLSIKIWQYKQYSISQFIHTKKCHDERIQQMQFNKEGSAIITLDILTNFKHWLIDYKSKQIKLIHTINQSGVFNCSFVDGNYIQLVGKKSIYCLNILNQYAQEYVREYDDQEGMCIIFNFIIQDVYSTKQVESRKYVIIQKLTRVIVLGPSL